MPLAEYLAPLIFRKANELEATLGPPGEGPPMQAGYLQAGYEKTPYDPRGLVDKPKGGAYFDPNTPAGREAALMGQLQRSDNPYTRTFANSYLKARDGTNPPPGPLPTSPAAPMKLVKKGEKAPRVLQLDPAAAVGTNERGESVTAKGKKLGYLAQPSIETPSGSTPMRTGDRQGRDVSDSRWDRDKFSDVEMEKRYGKHYQEWNDYRGPNKDGFPDDYFKGMSAADRKNIIEGVKALRERKRRNATTGEGGISA